ncbi:MAG: putative rane protein [Ilumatobacteraceae bacterium]|nr:putative rane protein [Ilumatobacteraceae bacterium]
MGCPLNDAAQPVDPLWGVVSPGESRWPATLAVLVIVLLQLVMPNELSFGPRWLWPTIALPLEIALIASNPSGISRESRDVRKLAIAMVVLLSVANATTLALLLHQLLSANDPLAGRTLLWSALGVWVRNVIVFAVWYWELDRGGPLARCSADHAAPDFLFPQMQAPAVSKDPWSPRFFDYLYVSLTNSTAFSPTDALPTTRTAKLLMGMQSLVSLATIVIVGARAVNILN